MAPRSAGGSSPASSWAHGGTDPLNTPPGPRHGHPASPGHNLSLEGLRAVAALGIVVTHVGFQTGLDPASHVGAVVARFDFFVAVFYALSAFVLWRAYGPRTRRLATAPGAGKYLAARAARILPAYLVLVAAVIVLLPEATAMTLPQILTNLTLTQIYIPNGLVAGLTHLWSLAVEVAFYLVLPVIVVAVRGLGSNARIAVIALAAVVSLGWAFVPFVGASPADGVANRQIWPPAYTAWFAVGLIAAECEPRITPRARRALSHRWPYALAALAVAWVAGQEWFSPLGLTHPEPHEFARRILAGTLFAALVVLPPALAPRQTELLSSPVMTTLGKWSYSIFLWHVALMALLFPVLGIPYFSGGFLIVLAATVAVTVAVAALSYQFIEAPGQRLFKRAYRRRPAARPGAEARAKDTPTPRP